MQPAAQQPPVLHGPTCGPVEAAEAAEVLALAARAQHADGIEALSEQTLLDLDVAGPRHWFVHATASPGGGGPGSAPLVAYAQLGTPVDGSRSAELVVDPDARRAGIGGALLDALLAASGSHRLLVWAHGDLPGARALAARAGLEPVRSLWRMTRTLDQAVPAVPIDGLRPFVPGQDEDAWVELNRAAFASHPEQGRLSVADLEAREREPWFDPDDLLLLERDGTAVAYLWLKVEPPDGELYALGVSPEAQGERLGSTLTARAVAHLAARGLRRAVLYTDAGNTAAVRAYTAAGFRQDRVDLQYGARAPRTSPEDATMPS
ncbi:mycothiol synthase [Actinotalea sp.]|uniref:mycothiol synthase n=1 Tax=Actinotalea sp. TaxID=1872145 RepID=UPI003563CECF